MIIKNTKIIAIDVGTAIVGWAILERNLNKIEHIASGVIETSKNNEMRMRLKKIFEDLNELVDLYAPQSMAVEGLFFFKNQKTIISVGQARGVILLSAALKNLKTFDYTPLQVKMAVSGYGRAEKAQVQFMVTKILNLTEVPKPDDIADAMALGICHLNSL